MKLWLNWLICDEWWQLTFDIWWKWLKMKQKLPVILSKKVVKNMTLNQTFVSSLMSRIVLEIAGNPLIDYYKYNSRIFNF